jgi:fibronectin type 3 domain-containing protein
MVKRIIGGMAVFVALFAGVSGCGSSTPDYPTSLSSTIGAGRVYLSWTPAAGTAVGYNVYRGTASGPITEKAKIASNITDTAYIDTTAVGGTNYYYQVTALIAQVTVINGTPVTTNVETLGSNEVVGTP